MTRSKNDNVITKLNLHQSAFSADFFNRDIQVREMSLQALVPLPPPPPPQQKPKLRCQELAPQASQYLTSKVLFSVLEVLSQWESLESLWMRKRGAS